MTRDDANRTDAVVQALSGALQARAWRLTCAESCTGGLIAAACTAQAGSSLWFDRGYVTYSNEAKIEMLGVSAKLIEEQGAVSEAVVRAMAQGALAASHAQAHASIAVSGVAGPGGGSVLKPVGLVWFAWAWTGASGVEVISAQRHFDGDRAEIRRGATVHALQALLPLIQSR